MSTFFMQELDQGSVIPIAIENKIWMPLIFSSVGMILCTLALLLLILTAILFVEWRSSYKNQLLIQFMLARFFYTFVRYLNDIQNIFDIYNIFEEVVTLDVLLLIYSEMALVSWMFVFSRQMYLSLVKVFDPESVSIWKVSLCAWIVPGVLSCLLCVLYYVQKDMEAIDFVFYIIIIKWPVLIINAVLLVLVFKSVLKSNSMNTNTYRSNFRIVLVMVVMIFMFCFQQMFIDVYKLLFFYIEEISVIAASLFTSNIVTMYHCAFSILFWVFGNRNTRTLWKFKRKELRKKATINVRFSA